MKHWTEEVQGQQTKHGFLIIHGKTDGPSNPLCSFKDDLADFSKNNLVDYREYAWGYSNPYNTDLLNEMDRITEAKKNLISRGATNIHIISHSLGVTATLLYMTQVRDISSIIFASPGHNTGADNAQSLTKWSRDKATELLEQSNDEPTYFVDFNNGAIMPIKCKPSCYISYFSPDGPGNARTSANNIGNNNPGLNILLVSGTEDATQTHVLDICYKPLRPSSKSKFIKKLGYDHVQTMPFILGYMKEWTDHLG